MIFVEKTYKIVSQCFRQVIAAGAILIGFLAILFLPTAESWHFLGISNGVAHADYVSSGSGGSSGGGDFDSSQGPGVGDSGSNGDSSSDSSSK